MRRLALPLAWAALTIAVAWTTAPAVGFSRDEGIYFVAAESYASWWRGALAHPSGALGRIDARYAVNHEHPALAKGLFGLTHAVLTDGLGVASHAQGFRAGAFLFGALLSFLLARAGGELAGWPGALLAPALFWCAPRHFYHLHPAVFDLAIAALWFAVVEAYRWSLRGGWRRALVPALAFGAALGVKHNAWFLPPLLLAHWVALRLLDRERAPPFPRAIPLMVLLGPAVFVLTWPWLWHDTLARAQAYLAFHLHHENYAWLYFGTLLREPPFPVAYPFVVTALTVPGAVLATYVGGLAQAAWRAARGAGDCSLELLLALNALFPMALIAWPTVPHFGGVKHWLPAMPFLALLGARALAEAGRALAPRRAALATLSLAALALAPAAWSVARQHPFGTASYGDLAGGPPGAASLGLQRQFWGDDVRAVLPAVNAHAAPGARIWWQEATSLDVRAYRREGLLRPDLREAEGPEDADLSLWQHHREFMDKQFRTWTELGTRRPVAGAWLEEVPLVEVYAREGAWR
ncbi:ArnT family glycosyltransferase [Anaeromyxobacter paludicola]|nr:hypothetical protein [Anaeromyxobacter paludicola]